MATIAQVRAGFKTTIENTISGLFVYRTVPEIANLPAVACSLAPDETANFTVAMGRGTDTWNYDLYVLAAYRDAEIGQDDLDQFIDGNGDKSIRQAIFNNRSLGLPNVDAHISGVSQYGSNFETNDLQHVGAVMRLVVHTKGE
jgi:hypothetical protein